MSQLWSEINHVVNCFPPETSVTTTGLETVTDIINLENYKACTFVVSVGSTGGALNNKPTITVLAGATATGATTAIGFKYRHQITGDAGATGVGWAGGTSGSDIPSELHDTTGAGFAMSTDDNGGVYIIEIDPSDVIAVTTSGAENFNHVKLLFTQHHTDVAAQIYGCLAILSEPRYPQAILQTAID